MKREDVLTECRTIVKGRGGDVKAFMAKFNDYLKSGHLDVAIRNYTEEMFKLTYEHWRFSEILDALENIQKENIKDFLERVLQDSLERGFLRMDVRHNNTNEMDNITRRWKVEIEPVIYTRVNAWLHRISTNG